MKLIDIQGQRFGRLLVLRKHAAPKLWECQCDCGALHLITGASLRKGAKSCGCMKRELMSSIGSNPDYVAQRTRPRTHGEAGRTLGRSPEYRTWRSMRERCNRPTHKDYPRWGGRGIRVCERWDSFENFLADMGRKPGPEYSIDRLDPDKNYGPDNCRWATPQQQGAEHRRDLRGVVVHGQSFPSFAAACRHFGVPVTRTHMRLRAGQSLEEAFGLDKQSRWKPRP